MAESKRTTFGNSQVFEYDGLHDPTAIGFLPHTRSPTKVLRGLGLIVKRLDDELAEAINTASLVGAEQALSAALEKMPERDESQRRTRAGTSSTGTGASRWGRRARMATWRPSTCCSRRART